MLKWTLNPIKLPLHTKWKISRGEVQEKVNYIVEVSNGVNTGLGEVALPTASQEQDQIPFLFKNLPLNDFGSLNKIIETPMPSPLKFGLTSAWTHLHANKLNQSVSQYLQQHPEMKITTSHSIPILSSTDRKNFVNNFNLSRFQSIKVKIDRSDPVSPCIETYKLTNKPLRVDANQSFQSKKEVLDWIKELKGIPIEFIEQPLPVNYVDDSVSLKQSCSLPIIGDESITDQIEPEKWKKQFDGINLKLMKSGSYQTLIKQREIAKKEGLLTMIGCMIESSLGISCALHIASHFDYYDLDSTLLIAQDPYSLIEEKNGELSLKRDLKSYTPNKD